MKTKTLIFILTIITIIFLTSCTKRPVCGNGIIEKGETIQTCCEDVGCLGEQICKNHQCIEPACEECQYVENYICKDYECCKDFDCNDNNLNTNDICINPKTFNSICEYKQKCKDECQEIGLQQCFGGGYKTCGNYDSDPCLEWNSKIQCPDVTKCIDGRCKTLNICNDGNNYELTSTNSIFESRTRKPTSYIVPHSSIKLGIKNLDTGEVNYNTNYAFESNKPSLVKIENNLAIDNTKKYDDYDMFIDITIPELSKCNNIKQPMRVIVGHPFLGENIAYIYPKDIIPKEVLPSGQDWATISVKEMMETYDFVRVTDLVYNLEEQMFGIKPLEGDILFLSLMPPWCGGGGQPIGLGVGCLIQPNNEPHWGVVFHEMGHDFTGHFLLQFVDGIGGQYTSNRAIFGKWGGSAGHTPEEGIATLAALYAEYHLITEAESYGITGKIFDGINKQFTSDTNNFLNDLKTYESQGNNFASMKPNIIDGIFVYLANNESLNPYGWELYPKFFKIYLDPLPSFVTGPLTEIQGHTYFIAGLSAASGSDLRNKFKNWGFSIDEDYYNKIYPKLNEIIN